MILQYWQRFRRVWLGIFALLAMLGVGISLLNQGAFEVFNPTCDARPSYDPGVDPTVQAKLNYLYDNGLLYCAEPKVPFRGLRGPIYWGSDGMSALLFFQADSLAGVGIVTYLYNNTYRVGPPGDSPPYSYGELRAGRPALVNQAPDDATTYFYRRDGAPLDSDAVVNISIDGPAQPRTSAPVGGRSVWRDVDRIIATLRGTSPTTLNTGTARATVALTFLSERWRSGVRRAGAEPFIDEDGTPDLLRLRDAQLEGTLPAEPFVFQRSSGAFGQSLWAANVVTATVPALVLVPLDAPSGAADTPSGAAGAGNAAGTVRPISTSVWQSAAMLVPLAVFAFDPLPVPAGTPLEARYWADGTRLGDGTPPDHVWSVTFP